MTRKTRRPCRKRLRARLPLSHATVLFGSPRQVSDRLRGLLLSTPPFSERYPTSAYATHQQVEPISNLYCMRSTIAGSCGIVTRSITADELNTRMRLEPTFQATGGTIRKQIDDLMILEVDQNGAIGDVATKRPTIYPKMGGRGMRHQWCPTNEPQKGIGTTSHLEDTGNASSCFATQCEA